MESLAELYEKRARIVKNARKEFDLAREKAEAENRDIGADVEATLDRALDEADQIGNQIKTAEAANKRQSRLSDAESSLTETTGRRGAHIEGTGSRRTAEDDDEKPYVSWRLGNGRASKKRAAYREWLRHGVVQKALEGEARSARIMRAEIEQAGGGMDPETRDLLISTTGQGGAYLITPVEISDDIVKQIDNMVFVRELCRSVGSIKTVTSAQKLGIRRRPTRMDASQWTTEIGGTPPDAGMSFDRRDLEPQQLSKLALVSLRTLMLSADAETEVTDEIAYQQAVAQEAGFLTGTGSSQPLGLFTASASGVPTSQDVTAANATTITGDDLINMKFSLRQPYLKGPAVAWVLHRLVVKIIRKIKTSSTAGYGDLQYVWQPGLTSGEPDTILDIPYYMSEYAPSTVTSGLYTAVLGNFKYYRIAELPSIMIQRLTELYAGTGEIGFIARTWVDGSPVLGEAWARLKQA